MYELRSYLPKVKEIFSDIIEKYNFEVYAVEDHQIRLSNSNCIIKMTVGKYYLDFILEFINPRDSSHKGITSLQIAEKKGLDLKTMLSKEELEKIKRINDEVEQYLYAFLYKAKYYQEYLEGNFD